MRYRQLSPTGDYQVSPAAVWLVNSPACVAQAVLTRLRLLIREWFLDLDEGLNTDKILGVGTQGTRDAAVKTRILGTPGVVELVSYQSNVSTSRAFTVTATINTLYGEAVITETFT